MRIYMPIVILVLVIMLPAVAISQTVDHSRYAGVLKRHVRNGLVDYEALKANRAPLDKYLEKMGAVDPDTLSRNGQLAFYINLYNAATLQLIIDHYPIESIKDIGSIFSSPWKARFVQLNGRLVSLDHIEHEIIRPRFQEPRVHFALNCSAMSCPPLRGEPYTANTLEEELARATTEFINDGKNNFFVGRVLYVSKIFDWFSEDFPDDLPHWLKRYARGTLFESLDDTDNNGGSLRVDYLDYDWSLNDLPR